MATAEPCRKMASLIDLTAQVFVYYGGIANLADGECIVRGALSRQGRAWRPASVVLGLVRGGPAVQRLLPSQSGAKGGRT